MPLRIEWGNSRVVVIGASVAVKFAFYERGRRNNHFEQRTWSEHQRQPNGEHLCPVLWSHPDGHVLIMPAADPLPADADMQRALEWWDYVPPCGPQCPWEFKPQDWGVLGDKWVAVDYAVPADIVYSAELRRGSGIGHQ